MKKTLLLLITTFLTCGSVHATSLFYCAQGGANDGVYKVDMDTGSYEQFFSGSYTSSIKQFDIDKIIVTDRAGSQILVIDTEGDVCHAFATVGEPNSSIRNPDNPDELLYTSYSTGQVRKININSGEDSLVTPLSNAHCMTARYDGSVFVSSWSNSTGSTLNDLSDPATSVLATTWITSLVGDDDGNLYYSGHPVHNPHSIAKIEFGDTVTNSAFWQNSNIYIGGVTYDSTNDRILAFGYEGGNCNLYSFDPDSGDIDTVLTNLALPVAAASVNGGHFYTLILNPDSNYGSSAVPEPMTLLLLFSGITSFFVRKNI